MNTLRARGFVLVPVILALVVVAALAMLLNLEGPMNVEHAAAQSEAHQVDLLAQAGLAQAEWRLQGNACAGDFVVPSTTLNAGTYTATTSGLGTTTTYNLTVDQDAWIRSDQPTTNNGTTIDQHIRFEAGNTEQALYRFNLAALPAGAQINSASAWFYIEATKEHPEGPITVHRVTSDWLESDATWNTMNGNFEAAEVARIPAQDQGAVWVRVNLTAQVQGWVNGQPNFGILMASASEGVHAEYVSSEGAGGQQPRLDVVVGSVPAGLANIQVSGTLANGNTRTLNRTGTAAHQPSSTLILQPGASESADTYLYEWQASWNYGSHSELFVSNRFANSYARGLLRYDLSAIPYGARIISATLELYQSSTSVIGGSVGVRHLTADWLEGTKTGAKGTGATWNEREPGIAWASAGGDLNVPVYATATIPVGTLGYFQWDIAPLVERWVAGEVDNFGLVLEPLGASTEANFASSDDTDPARHPKLTITYACQCGMACLAPQGSGAIVMVVGDDVTLAAADAAKKALFESWGYSVTLIDDAALPAAFDSALASHDVAYVSETVNGLFVWTKLTSASIGVVSEEGFMNGLLGLASLYANAVATAINVTDNSHYITAPFPAGALDIYAAAMDSLTVAGTPAPGLQQLADIGGAGGLVVLERGDALDPSGNAAGRRVMLPLGRNGSFNWDYLNNNGRLIVQRAIEWGKATPPASTAPGLWLSTTTDVTASGVPGLPAWSNGQALAVADPNFVLEPSTTAGTFSASLNLDSFAADSDAAIDAMHYVNAAITVGSANSVDLVAGDVLLSTAANETLTSTNSLAVNNEDVFVFRPDSAGDYGAGTFIFLLDGSQIHSDATVGISLIEKDTTVGDGTLSRGTFLLAVTNRRDVIEFTADDVGAGTTTGGFNEFIDGPSLNLSSEIRGIDLVEDKITIGTQVVPAGSILLTLNNDDTDGVGDNLVAVDGADIFYLSVTVVGASPVADATKLFEGLDVNLDTAGEHLQALTLINTVPGPTVLKVLFVVADALALTAQETAHVTLMTDTWGFAVTLIGQSATQGEFDNAAALNDVVYVSHDVTLQSVGDKLRGFTIGVVNEEYLLSDELGFSGGTGSALTTTLNITDDAHDITAGFSNGALTIFNANAAATGAAVVLAPTRRVLGKVSTISALMALETGSTLYGGGSAAGRRVQVPWGYVFSALNADGQTLMRQAIEWAAETGTPGAPLLFVVSDDNTPSDEEILRKHLVESWGYMVTVVEDSDSQANFDAFVAANDVAYISEEVDHTLLTTKLSNAAIGVVNEDRMLYLHLGFANAIGTQGGMTATNITDNTHDITTGFGLGNLVITASGQTMTYLQGTLSVDLQGLADHPSVAKPALSALYAGDALYGGGNAAGRRVWLPWGGDDFTFSELNSDGHTILQRALLWSAGSGGGGGGGGTFRDEFNTIGSYAGDDGTLSWATDWLEVGESDGASTGDELVVSGTPGITAQVQDNDSGGEGLQREADLSGATTATLTFIYWRRSLDNADDYVTIDVSANGGTNWTELGRITGPGTDSTSQAASYNIGSDYFAPNARIRFLTSPTMGSTDKLHFDDVQIERD